MEWLFQLDLFLYWNLKITSKEGKLSQRFPWKVGCQLSGFRAGGEAEEQKLPRVELQPGKDKRGGQDESRPEREPVGSSDEEADWELLGSVVDEKVQASKKKKPWQWEQ